MTAKTTRHAHKDAEAVWLRRTSPGAAKKKQKPEWWNGEVIHRKRCSSPRGLRSRPLDPASTGRLHRPARTAALTNPAQGTTSLESQPKGVPPLEPCPTVRRLDAARPLPVWTGQQGLAPDTRFSRFGLPDSPATPYHFWSDQWQKTLARIPPANGAQGLGQLRRLPPCGRPHGRLCFWCNRKWKNFRCGQAPCLRLLAAGFGGLVLCAKAEERRQWEKWAAETGRTDDLVIVDASGNHRFNFMNWEIGRA